MESSAFTALTEQIAEIAAHVRAVSGGRKEEAPDRLLTTREAAHLLNVSCRTLQRMRSEQRIAYVVLRGKVPLPAVGNRPPARRQHRYGRCRDTGTVETQPHAAHGRQTQRKEGDMELLTRNNFENWMQKVMERLDRQDEMLLSMQPSGKAPNPMEGIRIFDNQDLCMLLQISKRTLQRYRSIGALPYKTPRQKTYYSEADVLTFLSEHVKDFRKEDIAFYKARIHNFFQK